MVVALRALQARAQQHLRDRLAAHGRRARGAVKIRRGIRVRAAARRHDGAREFIHRPVRREVLANPVMKPLHALGIQTAHFDTQQISPLERPKIRELGPL